MLVVHLISILVILQDVHTDNSLKTDPRVDFQKKMNWTMAYNPWVIPIYAGPNGYYRPFDSIGLFILNEFDTQYSRDAQYIATGAFISSTRIVTSFNPFKEILKDPEAISKTFVLSVSYFKHSARYGPANVAPQADTIQCGREIIPLPDDADVFYIDKEKLYSPLHDIMVFRVSEPKMYFPLRFHHSWFAFDKKWKYYGRNRPGAVVASPIDNELYEDIPTFYIVGLGFINETEVKLYNKMHFVELYVNPVDFLDCDNWIPREWGYFICIRNFIGVPVLPSGSLLLSEYRLYGIGSFMLTRNREEILVFTDVRPYRSRILRACSIYEFKPTKDSKIWW